MSVFSTNQNRQFYVATSVGTVTESSATGAVQVKCINEGNDKLLYFLVKGAKDVLKSDMISLKNLNYIKAVPAADMAVGMKKILLTVDSSLLSGGNLKYTDDYVLRIAFRQFYGMSDEDQYFKDAAVRGVAGTSAEDFYAAMVESLNRCFSREVGATKDSNPYLTFSSSAAGIVIEEKEQEWSRGIESAERVYFEVVPTTIYNSAIGDVDWGTVAVQTSTTTVGNGKKIADLEWFCLGERGDQYRMMGYPNYIPTTYLVDETKRYNVLELHFGFTDTGVNSYRSEKDITFVSDSSADAIDALVEAINTATGLSVEKLPE